MYNEGLEAVGGLILDPVLEDESQDAGRHLQEEQHGKEDGVGRQERCVLPQGADAAGKAYDEGDGSCPDEEEGGVQRYVGEQGKVVESIFLRPGPDADRQHAEANELDGNQKSKNKISSAKTSMC